MTLQDEGTQEDDLRGQGGAVVTAAPPRTRRLIGRRGGAGEPRSRQTWILIVCCVAQFMVILDLSIVNVALPSIQSSLGFSSADLQWVIDGYAIAFAGFLMLGGRAADHFGQRRTFVLALLLFALASLFGGIAPTQEVLVAARIAQGVAGALMAASSLAIITSSFAPGPELHRAVGIWASMNGLGGAAGVLFGGIITEALSWRWVLLINPPIGIVAALVAFRVVRDVRREDTPPFDIAGALTLTIGQMILVYGVVQAGLRGWHAPLAIAPILIGFVLLGLFGLIETRFAKAPLIPFKELTKPLKNANTIVLLFSAALFPMWYLGSLYLQQVLGLSPLKAGLIFLPMAATIGIVARFAGKLVSRYGVRAVLGGGLTMMTAGMLLFTKIAASGSGVVYIMIPGLLTAAGIALSIVPSTIAATQGAKQGQAGLASGLVNTSRQVGGGLGLAVLITLATTYTSNLIGQGHGVPQSLTGGFRLGYYICAGLCAVAAILTFALIPKTQAETGSIFRRAPIALAVTGVIALFIAVDFAFGGSHGAPIGAYTTNGTYSYVTEPGLHPPKIRTDISTATTKLAPGYIFMANFYDLNYPPMVGQSGPMILDKNLQPVWFKPLPTSVVAGNLSRQTYQGKPVLAWWQGVITNTGATETGEYVIADQHYRTIATLHATGGWVLTLHEIVIRGDDAWVTANKNIAMDLSKYGGAYNGALIDSAVQEYNLKTGKLLYNWDALDHIPLSDSQASLPTNGFPWDAYHVNSINVPGDGTFVTSMRNIWAAYKVNIATGKPLWVLGGRHSTFKFGKGAAFQWQHHVTVYPGSPLVTVFDDHCCQITGGGTYVPATGPSRGLVLKLDQTTHTATLADQYGHGSNFDAEYMGSIEPLPNGNEFVGWGSAPYISEFTVGGQMLMDAALPHPDLTYRATLEPWVGTPLDPPRAAARQQGGRTTVYASWNGSTEVASWKVLGESSAGKLTPLAASAKSGFETPIPVTQSATRFTVQALDRTGRVIGESAQFGISR